MLNVSGTATAAIIWNHITWTIVNLKVLSLYFVSNRFIAWLLKFVINFLDVTTPKPIHGCKDLDYSCASDADRGRCHISGDRLRMTRNCKLSCKMCTPTNKCEDNDSICNWWGKQGYCKLTSKYHKFMMKNCKYTCNAVGCWNIDTETKVIMLNTLNVEGIENRFVMC